jgi:hypothetical protein
MNNLESTDLVPVYFTNGDPTLPFSVSKKKVKMEPWRYTEYISEAGSAGPSRKKSASTLSSVVADVPNSKRAILDLLEQIIPTKTIKQITQQEFLSEDSLFDLVKQYFSDDWDYDAGRLNDLIGKAGSWGTTKQKGGKDRRV